MTPMRFIDQESMKSSKRQVGFLKADSPSETPLGTAGSTAREEAVGIFRSLAKFRLADHGGELGGDFRVRAAQRLRRSDKVVAAARSTRLRPIHFIHFIAAAVINRGS